jgi:hypothetical protein
LFTNISSMKQRYKFNFDFSIDKRMKIFEYNF